MNKYKTIFKIESEHAAKMAELTKGYPFAFQVLSVFSHGGVPALQEGLSRAWAGERPVSILTDDETVRGIFTGIDDQGNPVLSLPAGTVRTIPAHLINRLLEE